MKNKNDFNNKDIDIMINNKLDSLLSASKNPDCELIEEILRLYSLTFVIDHISFNHGFYNVADLNKVTTEMKSQYLEHEEKIKYWTGQFKMIFRKKQGEQYDKQFEGAVLKRFYPEFQYYFGTDIVPEATPELLENIKNAVFNTKAWSTVHPNTIKEFEGLLDRLSASIKTDKQSENKTKYKRYF